MNTLRAATLAALMLGAGYFHASGAQVSAPEAFEVVSVKATPPEWTRGRYIRMQTTQQFLARPTLDQQMAMLRQLLTDRFRLQYHREMRDMPYYALTVVRTGHKLGPRVDDKPALDGPPEGPPPQVFVIEPQLVRLPATSASMVDLAWRIWHG